MNCHEVENLLYDYETRRISNEHRIPIDMHLQTCQTCNESLNLIKQGLILFEHCQPPKPPVNFTERVLLKTGIEFPNRQLRLAASSEQKNGKTYGVAVDEESGNGVLVEIFARVSKPLNQIHIPKIVGKVQIGEKRHGIEHILNDPLEILADKLLERFQNIPCLLPLNLHKRDIYVEIKSPGYLFEIESLHLAIIMAIVKAVTDYSGLDNIVYSADIDLNGRLTSVGRLESKINCVLSKQKLQLILSITDFQNINPSQNILSFETLSELFENQLGSSVPIREHSKITSKKSRFYSFLHFFVIAFAFSGAFFFNLSTAYLFVLINIFYIAIKTYNC